MVKITESRLVKAIQKRISQEEMETRQSWSLNGRSGCCSKNVEKLIRFGIKWKTLTSAAAINRQEGMSAYADSRGSGLA